VLITKSLKNIGHDRNISIISNNQFQDRKRVRDKDNNNRETLKTKKTRLIIIFALLAKAIKRDSSYSNIITNRILISVSYKTTVNNPIFDF